MIPIIYQLPQWATALLFLVLLFASLEVSYRFALWRKNPEASTSEDRGNGNVVPSAMLALLGLLLAFTYSFTMSRSDNRKAAVLREVNAVGTAFYRADLLDEPVRADLRTALLVYARTLPVKEGADLRESMPVIAKQMKDAQAELWPVVSKLKEKGLGPYETSVVGSINEVFDTHEERMVRAMDRLPIAVLLMLLFVACAAMAVAGYSSGRQGSMQRWRMTALAMSIAAVMTTVTDFDRPLSGFVQSSQQGYHDLIADMESELKR